LLPLPTEFLIFMKKRYKLKINGECPRSLFLAYVLANLNCDIYLYNFYKESISNNHYQSFYFSNFSKNLLNRYGLWNEFKNISYGFNSLCIKDRFNSEQFVFRTEDFPNSNFNTIGWTANYSDIRNSLLDKLINLSNVHFISKQKFNNRSYTFDYELNFNNYNKIFSFFKSALSFFERTSKQIYIFNVLLRGNVEKRLYEIHTRKGLIVLIPLDKNLYQIIWNYTSLKKEEIFQNSKSFFLDNLTTILPSELKVDQIRGEINSLRVNSFIPNYIIKRNSIYFNENKFKNNVLYELNFDIFIKNILQVYSLFNNNKSKNFYIFNKIRLYCLIKKYIVFIKNISFTNFFIDLFISNNIIIIFLRRFLFNLIKRNNLLKNLIKNCFYKLYYNK